MTRLVHDAVRAYYVTRVRNAGRRCSPRNIRQRLRLPIKCRSAGPGTSTRLARFLCCALSRCLLLRQGVLVVRLLQLFSLPFASSYLVLTRIHIVVLAHSQLPLVVIMVRMPVSQVQRMFQRRLDAARPPSLVTEGQADASMLTHRRLD